MPLRRTARLSRLLIVLGALLCAGIPARAQQPATLAPDPIERWENNPDGTKITGGWKTNIAFWPGFASLRYKLDGGDTGYYCGGVMISAQWMLTAAHCLNGWACNANGVECRPTVDLARYSPFGTLFSGSAVIEVVVGVDNLANVPGGQVFQIEMAYRHEVFAKGYTSRKGKCNRPGGCAGEFGNDIALVKIAGTYRGPFARLAAPDDDPPEDGRVPVMAAGFGWREEGATLERFRSGGGNAHAASKELLETLVPTVPNALCQRKLTKQQIVIQPKQICATDEKARGRDACHGDSGGPLVAYDRLNHPYVVGLTSYGIGCAKGDNPGVFTRVSSFRPWIEARVGTGQLQSVQLRDRFDPSIRRAILQAVGQFKPTNRPQLTMKICSDGNTLGCSATLDRLPKIDPDGTGRLVVNANSDIGGALVVFLVTLDGRVQQIFPSGGATGAIRAGEVQPVPDAPTNFSTGGLPFGWDVVDGRLVGVVMPEAGSAKIQDAQTTISAAAKAGAGTRRAGLVPNPQAYLKSIFEAVEKRNDTAIGVVTLSTPE